MAQHLVPLPKFRNTLLLEQRLTMLDNGWPIIPTLEKKGSKGWPRMANDRKAVESWHKTRNNPHARYTNTSLRMTDDWFVIDIDVTDQVAVDRLETAYWDFRPDYFGYVLERNAGGVKLALFGRISQPFKTAAPIVYAGGHKVEFHGGLSTRHILLFGRHPDGGDYQWVGPSPLEVSHDELPIFDIDDLDPLRDLTAQVLDGCFERIDEQSETAPGERVYDLLPETPFFLPDGEQTSCGALAADLHGGDEVNGILGSRAAWEASSKKNHCRAKLNAYSGRFQVHDFSDAVTHYLESARPEIGMAQMSADEAALLLRAAALGVDAVPAAETGNEGQRRGRLDYTDLVGHSPSAKFIHRETLDLWPSITVDKRLPKVTLVAVDEKGKPIKMPASTYIMKTNAVEQLSWMPGEAEIVEDTIVMEGGAVAAPGKRVYNLYVAPAVIDGNAAHAQRWIDHVRMVYPAEASHIIGYFGHTVQFPGIKINHGLLLGGAPGIGKDSIIVPVREAVGVWNCQDVRPSELLSEFNKWHRCVLLRVNEMHDLGDDGRLTMYSLYERMKTILAAPPEMARINEKRLGEYYIPNVCKTVMTTNYKESGVYLPAEDRRNFVAWSMLKANEPGEAYFEDFHQWLSAGGNAAVAAYLRQMDVSKFNPSIPPPKTDAFWSIVNASRSRGDSDLDDLMELLKGANGEMPAIITIKDLEVKAMHAGLHDVAQWLGDPRYRRHVPAALERQGYVETPNPGAGDRKWSLEGRKQIVYRHNERSYREATDMIVARMKEYLAKPKR